jgi:hypothetical protein
MTFNMWQKCQLCWHVPRISRRSNTIKVVLVYIGKTGMIESIQSSDLSRIDAIPCDWEWAWIQKAGNW